MRQVKIWVMVSEPHVESRVEHFTGHSIEHAVEQLQKYLDNCTAPGTRTTVVQSGYVEDAGYGI